MTSASTALVNRTLIELGKDADTRAWRNNTGAAWMGRSVQNRDGSRTIFDPRYVTFGLPGSGDIIGLRRVLITQEMIGQTIGQFISVENKSGTGKQAAQQKKFGKMVLELGGRYVVARTPEDAKLGVLF